MPGHFSPISSEIGGYLKTFLVVWGVATFILLLALGVNYWTFFGAAGLGFIFAVFITCLLAWLTSPNRLSWADKTISKHKTSIGGKFDDFSDKWIHPPDDW